MRAPTNQTAAACGGRLLGAPTERFVEGSADSNRLWCLLGSTAHPNSTNQQHRTAAKHQANASLQYRKKTLWRTNHAFLLWVLLFVFIILNSPLHSFSVGGKQVQPLPPPEVDVPNGAEHNKKPHLFETAKLPPLAIDTQATKQDFGKTRRQYGNKADYLAIQRIFKHAKDVGLDHPDSVVYVGGTNKGNLVESVLKLCPNVTLYGFEIQESFFEMSTKKLRRYPNAHMVNLGWDEKAQENVAIGGSGGHAGLYDPKGQRGWKLQENKTANTIPMSDWSDKNEIARTLFVVIDTEGHEPKVIRGMGLDRTENQKRFPLFQYELGGTWAEKDVRHGNDQWDQKRTAEFLVEHGYLLLMAGEQDWLVVNPEFFDCSDNPGAYDHGFGKFIQGNLMAMHRQHTHPALAAMILMNARLVTSG